MIGLIPTVVGAGIVTKVSDHMFRGRKKVKLSTSRKQKATATRRTRYPNSKYTPF